MGHECRQTRRFFPRLHHYKMRRLLRLFERYIPKGRALDPVGCGAGSFYADWSTVAVSIRSGVRRLTDFLDSHVPRRRSYPPLPTDLEPPSTLKATTTPFQAGTFRAGHRLRRS